MMALRLVNGTGGVWIWWSLWSRWQYVTQTFPSSTASLSVNYNSTVPVSGSVGGHSLSVSEIPNHIHSSGVGGGSVAASGGSTYRVPGNNQSGGVNSSSIGQSHDHPWSGSINFNVNGSGSLDLRLQYIDVIICRLVDMARLTASEFSLIS